MAVLPLLVLVFSTGTVITIGIVGLQLRAKLKAIEILKVYAERGEEPPAAVVEAVSQIGRSPQPPPPHLRRSWHLSRFAGAVVLSAGGWGVFAWRVRVPHPDPDWLMVVGIVVGVFFAAHALARLTAALTSDGRR